MTKRPNEDAAAQPPGLSPAQLEVMQVVWDSPDGASVMEVWKALAARRQLARNTVQTMLARLEERGWLSHKGDGSGFRYFATRPRSRTLGAMVDNLVETAFGGAADELVMALLSGRGISKQEAKRIRDMIDRSEGDKR